MRKNSSTASLSRQTSGRIIPKKIQGYDMKPDGRVYDRTYNPSFKTTVQTLKSKPKTKEVEDQYINGLQDEIKYLEYELKLLKDKELQQQSTAQQLGKFFDDGVTLNENILAIKNTFTNQKTTLETKTKNLTKQCAQRSNFIDAVITEIQRLRKCCSEIEKEKRTRDSELPTKLQDLARQLRKLQHESKLSEDVSRELQVKHRKAKQQLETLKLNTELSCILTKQNVRNVQILAMKTQLEQKDSLIVNLQCEKDRLTDKVENGTAVGLLQKENDELKNKILTARKEINLLSTRVQETRFLLDAKMKERGNQAALKRDFNKKLQSLKKTLQIENKLTEADLQSRISEKQKEELRMLQRKRQTLMKYINFKKAQTNRLEAQTQQILSGKGELQQKLTNITNEVNKNEKTLSSERERQTQFTSQIESLETLKRYLEEQRDTTTIVNNKLTQGIEFTQSQIQRLKKENHIKEKQMELIKELKSFDLEELKLIRNTSNHVQDSIVNFLKKWDHIRIPQ